MKKLGILAGMGAIIMGCGGSGDEGANYPGRLNTSPDAVNRATRSLAEGKAKSVTLASNGFGFALLQELAKKEPSQNIFISPASISTALAMTFNGAEGGTKSAMEKALGLSGLTLQGINDASKDLRTVLAAPDKGVELDIANSLWVRQGTELKREFLGRNEDYFGAKVSTLDFSKPESVDAINVWVSEATKERIKSITEKIPADIVLYLINAVYFKGQWQEKFDPKLTLPREFTPFDGKKREVPMMSMGGEFEYQKAEKFASVRLPYGTGRIGMYVMLPNEKSSAAELVKLLSQKNWDAWLPKYKKIDGKVSLPKFKAEYSAQLKEALTALGMGEAFDEGKANFAGMSASPPLVISTVQHKTFVEVSEEGTEAAATTDVGMKPTAMPIEKETFEFVANRPFVYAIVDRQTGAILFLGVMGDPL